jgi:hypothetical protein
MFIEIVVIKRKRMHPSKIKIRSMGINVRKEANPIEADKNNHSRLTKSVSDDLKSKTYILLSTSPFKKRVQGNLTTVLANKLATYSKSSWARFHQ